MDIHTLENKTIPQRKYSHFADEGKVYYFKDENTVAYYDLSNQKHKIFAKLMDLATYLQMIIIFILIICNPLLWAIAKKVTEKYLFMTNLANM